MNSNRFDKIRLVNVVCRSKSAPQLVAIESPINKAISVRNWHRTNPKSRIKNWLISSSQENVHRGVVNVRDLLHAVHPFNSVCGRIFTNVRRDSKHVKVLSNRLTGMHTVLQCKWNWRQTNRQWCVTCNACTSNDVRTLSVAYGKMWLCACCWPFYSTKFPYGYSDAVGLSPMECVAVAFVPALRRYCSVFFLRSHQHQSFSIYSTEHFRWRPCAQQRQTSRNFLCVNF